MKKLFEVLFRPIKHVAFICYFAVVVVLLILLDWMFLYLLDDATSTGLVIVGTIMFFFNVVAFWLTVVEVFKKYIKNTKKEQ